MKVAAGAAWVVIDKLVKTLGGLLVGVLVTRYLGPSDLGVLNYGLLTLTVCMGFIPGALKYYAIKEMGAESELGAKHFNFSVAQIVWMTGLGYVVGVLMLWAFAPTGGFVAGLLVLSSALFYPLHAIKYQMEFAGDFKKLVIIENTGFVLAALAKIAVMYFDWGLQGMAITYLVEVVVVALLLGRVLAQKPGNALFKNAFGVMASKDFYQHMRQTSPLLMTAIIAVLYSRVDQLIIAYFMAPHDLGLYASAMRINEMSVMYPTILMTALYPFLSRQYALSDRGGYTVAYRGMMALLIYGALLYTLFIQVFAQQVTVLLFGASYKEAAVPLSLIAWSTLTTYVGYLWHAWMVLEGKGSLLLKGSVVCVALSFAGSVWVVPHYGIEGAASSTAVAFMLSAVYGFSLYSPKAFAAHVLHALIHPVRSIKGFYALAAHAHHSKV